MKHQAISAARLEDIERAVYAHRDAVTLADARQELADTWAANAAKPVHPTHRRQRSAPLRSAAPP